MSQETSRSFRMDRPNNPPKLRRTSTMDKIKALVLQTYHKDSYMAHRRDWRQGLGHEGRYRRTGSPASAAERRPSWPVSLSPPTVARSVSYAAPSQSQRSQSQPARTPLRLPQPASTGRLAAAHGGDGESEEWQSSPPASRPTAEPSSPSGSRAPSPRISLTPSAAAQPSPRVSLTPSAAAQPSPRVSLTPSAATQASPRVSLTPSAATQASPRVSLTPSAAAQPSPRISLSLPTPAAAGRPRHHSSSPVAERLSAVSIEVSPLESESESESGAERLSAAAGAGAGPAETAGDAVEDDVFVAVPPTALPEEDPAESDTGEPANRESSVSPGPCDDKPTAPPAPPPPPKPAPPPPSPAPPTPTRAGPRRGSGDLLTVRHPSRAVSRRPSLPAAAADRSPSFMTMTPQPRTTGPAPLAVNGAHRPWRVAAGLAWADRQGPRQTARDLLDPRRLPEVTARQQRRWEDRAAHTEDWAGDDRAADLAWSGRPDLVPPTLTVTSLQVGLGRRIPLVVTPPVDNATDTALSLSSDFAVSESDGSPEAVRQRQKALSARLRRHLATLREEQRAVEEEAAANAALGAAVAARVEQLARPAEAERYRAAVEQVATITSLMLALGGRLSRTEQALQALPERYPEEKALLTSKRDKLSAQLSEARQLEEGVRRRRQAVDACLERYLSTDELANHRHFVSTKARLIGDAREIDDRIRRAEEQLAAIGPAALDL